MKPKKPRCENCGDETTFVTRGDRTPDFQRETLGWCQRCMNVWKKSFKDPYSQGRAYAELVRDKRQPKNTP